MIRWVWSALVLLHLVGCPHPTPARMDALAEPDPIEVDAEERIAARTCPPGLGVIYPGLGAFCDGRKGEGIALMSIAGVDFASAAIIPAVHGPPYYGGQQLPLIWLQDLYITSWTRPALDRQLAHHMKYVPRDTIGELAFAPINGHVLKRPLVWGGTLALIAGAFWVTAAQPAHIVPKAGVNWFGADVPAGIGWPLVGLTEAYTYEHVAIGEETLFRGLIQSSLARGLGPGGGWALGTLIFGAFHAVNAIGMSPAEKEAYFRYSIPYVTLAGAVMGLAYMDARYSLTSSVAMHFWYDFALSMLGTIVDPDNSIVAARFSGRF